MLCSVPGFNSTVWTWAGNDPFLNSTRCLPGLRGIDRRGGLTPCLVPSTKTSAQGRATILSVASCGGAGTAAATSASLGPGADATSLSLGPAPVSFALAVCSVALGVTAASRARRGAVGSLVCGGAFPSCSCADSGASTLAGPSLGPADGGPTDTTIFASPSEFR